MDEKPDSALRLKEIVHLLVLGWSATILTAGYLNIIKADPTFVASIFTGCLAHYGISRLEPGSKKQNNQQKPNTTRQSRTPPTL